MDSKINIKEPMCLIDVMAPMTRCDRGNNDNRDTTKAPTLPSSAAGSGIMTKTPPNLNGSEVFLRLCLILLL